MEFINEILRFLGQATLLIAIVTFLLKSYFKNLISQFFQKELEDYKHDLNLITEEKKFDYQRKLHDFNLYRTSRHESYPVLYRLALSAVNNIKESNREIFWPNFDAMGIEEIKLYYRNEVKDEFEAQKTLTIFDKTSDVSHIKTSIASQRVRQSMKDIRDFNNYFRENELYYSQEIILLTHPVLPIMNDISKVISFKVIVKQSLDLEIEEGFFKPKIDALDSDIKILEDYVKEVKEKIVKELTIGDYS
ncbi:hypothetical protein ACQ5SI_26280 [Peribacillus frigoritolerans]|uniref:hypothetical protein n=1 Tax=Peribacillus frigoritolerans TaxID=450367 RepID=UPI003D34D337